LQLHKKFASLLTSVVMVFAVSMPAVLKPAHAAGTNLIANESMEVANLNTPASWTSDGWGTNTRNFTYLDSGHTGSRSLKTTITAYTSGDAKWAFASVNVSPGTKYVYTDYYKSTIASPLVAEITSTTGALSYEYIGTANAATEWTQSNFSITTPANAKSLTVFHLISGVGSLTIDDASLTSDATVTPPPASGNLIANNSFETANGTLPASWQQDAWGTNNRTYTYANTGNTGTRSAKVQITSYTSGDAKWSFTPVNVAGDTKYTYSDYYQSTAVSTLVVMYSDAAGAKTYQFLSDAPASTTWKQLTADFTTPASAKTATVFHLIQSVGSLTIDDASLTTAQTTTPPVVTPPPASPNLTPNPSFETAAGNLPANWYQGLWGKNTATFAYNTTGHTGTRSAKVTMSNFVDGGAHWAYDSQPVTPGKVYAFSNWYQSNTASQVLVAVTMSNGTTQWLWLGNPYASDGAWTRFYRTFTMPTGAVSAMVYQSISSNGYITTDDYNFTQYVPNGFTTPMVSITFDDGILNQYANARPVLDSYGFKATYYVTTGKLSNCANGPSNDICYMTPANIKSLYDNGNEIGAHTVNHTDLTSLSATALTQELTGAQTTLQQIIGAPVTNFASPFGSVNLNVLTQSKKYYATHRGVQLGYNDKTNYNNQDLMVQDINSNTTVAQLKGYIDYAKATNTWLVLMYHDVNVDGTVDPGYNTTPSDFAAHMAYLNSSGVPVKTMAQALAISAAQL
jgi:peptidoglycan/xylan/chitin deacetylase (PgdA/CDA1 family)